MRIFRWLTATRRRSLVTSAAVVAAIPVVALAWWLGSPLFLNKTVNEEFPRTVNAQLPQGTTREEAETIMADAAGVDSPANEPMTAPMEASSTVALLTGNFRDEDTLHRGSGEATVYRLEDGSNVLRLEDLNVTNGPDLFVLLLKDPEGRDKDQGYINLGKLKGNRGNQNYDIPADVDPAGYNSVMIYCRAFSVVFSTAPLSTAA